MSGASVVTIENAVQQWATAVTGIDTFFWQESVARPDGLYGDIKLIAVVPLGTPQQLLTPVTIGGDPWVTNELFSAHNLRFSINAYRTGARDALNALLTNLWLTLPNEILINANLGFISTSTPLNISQVVNGRFEERAQMDVTLNAVGYAIETLNTIGTVPIQGVINEMIDVDFEVSV